MTLQFTKENTQILKNLLKEELTSLEERFTAKVESLLDEKLGLVRQEIASLQSDHKSMKSRLLQLETVQMMNQIEIVNFPLTPKQSATDIFARINEHCGREISGTEIVRCTRSGAPRPCGGGACQNITVELVSRGAVDRLLAKIKKVRTAKGNLTANTFTPDVPSVEISIHRQLPKEMKKLRWLASKKKEALGYNFCWINESGRLMLRKEEGSKAIWVENEDILDKLRKSNPS